MLSSTFCSLPFWICYFWCGISDILDGLIARKLRQQSGIGAKLDSIADFIFAVTIIAIALLRLISYSIGFFKYRTFSSLHTLMNKITGISIFAFPLLYICFGLDVAGIMICIVAFLSSFEEIAIMIKSKELNRDIKSIFM